MIEELQTVEEVASKLKLHPETLRRYIRAGKISAKTVGGKYLISENDVVFFLKNCTSVNNFARGNAK